jgi:hypothetical protein
MNERIRELAEQARLVPEGQPSGSSPYYDALDNFARLIVRECAAIALREDHEPSECILRHFGVER